MNEKPEKKHPYLPPGMAVSLCHIEQGFGLSTEAYQDALGWGGCLGTETYQSLDGWTGGGLSTETYQSVGGGGLGTETYGNATGWN